MCQRGGNKAANRTHATIDLQLGCAVGRLYKLPPTQPGLAKTRPHAITIPG